jgi:2-keto-4-pentenoate hydratase/2-oxohepta-3-ene-1,7-dioic acid hydratase in catechol pathway
MLQHRDRVDGATLASTWQRLFSRDRPGKIVCVGLNYYDHADESGMPTPAEPLLFGKFPNTLVGPGEPIVLPPTSAHVDGEAELAVVIGPTAHNVDRVRAMDHVFGFTVANDVSARDLQFADGQWFRGKGFDTFCPVLPQIVPRGEVPDPHDLRVVQRVNGTVMQDGSTRDLIFDVPTLVAFASAVMTLDPGDLILTGTPPGVGYFRDPRVALRPGDSVEVEVEGIGKLTNPVVG